MEKYELIKCQENFSRRLKDLKEVLQIDKRQKEIIALENKMLEDTFWQNPKLASSITQKTNDLKETIKEFNNLTKEYEELAVIIELNDESLFDEAEKIINKLDKALEEAEIKTLLDEKYDAMILPASGGIAPKFDSEIDRMSDRYLILENHMAIANFGGFPSITIPNGMVNNMPIGLNITGACFKDSLTLNIANKIEEELGYKNLIKEEYDV